ncbi:hypothetical protein ACFL9U_12300 [Thermodesulfobacteriota bacterium]
MKKTVIYIFSVILLNCFFLNAHADVSQGRQYLFNGGDPNMNGLFNAKAEFEAAVQADPTNQEANFFLAITRLPVLVNDTASYTPGMPIENIKELLDSSGVNAPGRDLFQWTANFSFDEDGIIEVPTSCPTGKDIQEFLNTVVLPEIDQALSNLSIITDNFNILILASETGQDTDIEVDYGDVLLYESFLYAVKSAFFVALTYDTNLDIYKTVQKIKGGFFDINEDIFNLYPQILKPLPEGKTIMGNAKNTFLSCIDTYLAASAFIRAETDDPMDDLFSIDSQEAEKEEYFRSQLVEAKDSLIQERAGIFENDENTQNYNVDLNHFFGNSNTEPLIIRDFVPQIHKNGYIYAGTFPDTTFGGILVDTTDEAKLIDLFKRNLFRIIFIIPEKTMEMGGNESDWNDIDPITPEYSEFCDFGWWPQTTEIEYAKVSMDNNYIYWMAKFRNTLPANSNYSFSIFNPWKYGLSDQASANIQSDLSYRVNYYPSNTTYTGTLSDFGIGPNIVEGRIPKSQFNIGPILGFHFDVYKEQGWDGLWFGSILTTMIIPIVDAGPHQIVMDSVTLTGTRNYPNKNISSWEWILEHNSNHLLDRTATGQNPTVSDLAPGFYNVILRVTQDNGKIDQDNTVLVVGDTSGFFTQDQLDQAILNEKEKWDINSDGNIGLEEAIRALQIISGIRPE